MKRVSLLTLALTLCAAAFTAKGEEEPLLGPDLRAVPGVSETPYLRYAHTSAARRVEIAGDWASWSNRYPLTFKDDVWVLDVRPLKLPPGQVEYKFIVDKEWETGANRVLDVNPKGLLERIPEFINRATHSAANEVLIHLKKSVQDPSKIKVRVTPDARVAKTLLSTPRAAGRVQGYAVSGGIITFYFDESVYNVKLTPDARVAVAGNFNKWDGSGGNPRWRLRDDDNDGLWTVEAQYAGLRAPPEEPQLIFKFVIDGTRWLAPPADALNALPDGRGNVNLLIDPSNTGRSTLKIITREPIDITRTHHVAVDGLWKYPITRIVDPGAYLDSIVSDKELGAVLNREQEATTYRLWSPRASNVVLNIYDTYYFEKKEGEKTVRSQPVEQYRMWKDPDDGVWEVSLLGLDIGKYYAFQVFGPQGRGENFQGNAIVSDPYANASAHAENNAIVIDREATNRWFQGWTDHDYTTRRPEDVVVYEAHVRDLTMHPSSPVPQHLKGTYQGILASEGTGTGLDHLKDLGVNTIEFLPIHEFNNGEEGHNWGYTTVHFFAPEASYARDPRRGSQYYEFKHLVNELHRRGFGVLMDVVYNHVGWPNLFSLIDRKYFFRLKPDYSFQNYSGVGNDVRSEGPMMRRLIVDSIVYWTKEFKIDGYRFDLAELIDLDTLWAIRDAARPINPNLLLISEPWSFRGEHKSQLRGQRWSAWNNDIRYAAKDFVRGRSNRDWLKESIFGSVNTWAANPLQPVNYVESHDDMVLIDELTIRPDRDGSYLEPRSAAASRLASTIIFTSLGIPMIHEGQEFLRSKRGIHNSYNKGDEINALNWDDRDRPLAREALEYNKGLIALRASPEGQSFRVSKRPPEGYYRWIMPQPQNAMGYIVNRPRRHKGAGFIVLLNGNPEPVTFQVPFPEGSWKQIGNGEQIHPGGLPGTTPIAGNRRLSITVPGVESHIYMQP